MTDTTPNPVPRKGNWLRWVLVGSVALNVLLIGLVGGALYKVKSFGVSLPPAKHSRDGSGPRDKSSMMLFALDKQDRRALFKKVRQSQRADVRANRAQLAAANERIREAILAVPFEKAALEVALDAQHRTGQNMIQIGQRSFATVISEMTDEERKSYIARFDEIREKGRKKRSKTED